MLILLTQLLETSYAETSVKHDLIEIQKSDPSIKLDIRYATKNNFLGRPVYKLAKAYLQKEVAEDLIKANKEFKKYNYAIIVFDGYRPHSVTKLFWDETSEEKRIFVADPKIGSIHNRGCAVDLALYELMSGKVIKMPSEYDEFTERAYPSYKDAGREEKRNRDFLIKVMENHNFTVHSREWWHYDHKDCNKYGILDIPFEKL